MRRRWTEVRRTFTPSVNTPIEYTGASAKDIVMKMLYGFTTVELKDERGNVKFVTSYGDQRGTNNR